MSWVDVENAMQAAVARASGYPSTRVFWSYQNVNEPELDHIKISFGGERSIGIDRLHITQDLTRPNGQEIKQEVQGVREVPFEIECFTSTTSGNDAARRILELTRTKFRLPEVRSPLRKAALSPFDPGPVAWIPDIPSANFRGRASCTIRCYIPVSDCLDYVGYIARFKVSVFPVGWVGGHGASGFVVDSSGVSGYTLFTSTVYFGGAATPGAYNEAFITALSQAQKTSRVGAYVINAGSTLYSFWCGPTAFGGSSSDFLDDETDLETAMSKIASGVSVAGVPYDVWRTDVAGLGLWTLRVQ